MIVTDEGEFGLLVALEATEGKLRVGVRVLLEVCATFGSTPYWRAWPVSVCVCVCVCVCVTM